MQHSMHMFDYWLHIMCQLRDDKSVLYKSVLFGLAKDYALRAAEECGYFEFVKKELQ